MTRPRRRYCSHTATSVGTRAFARKDGPCSRSLARCRRCRGSCRSRNTARASGAATPTSPEVTMLTSTRLQPFQQRRCKLGRLDQPCGQQAAGAAAAAAADGRAAPGRPRADRRAAQTHLREGRSIRAAASRHPNRCVEGLEETRPSAKLETIPESVPTATGQLAEMEAKVKRSNSVIASPPIWKLSAR
ncbi:hypothetical protein ACVIW2_006273 [Bradyrhizobium huanghuaihaiense]|jgi:hypothetical protein|uniref:Uncharacterized protein n=6 Tax=Bradyrhizobium TaxID=374 RepID=A0ABV4FJ78_BRAEL|nr:hypothetical protein [Bradyrhizobium japonicum]TWH90554.1 hypothetical protein IQ17_07460 [Bradyrhizobium daqingense]TWI54137.1 hypothetical protein IQ16_08681 [Bradyrhizobium huanghuaihaiense]